MKKLLITLFTVLLCFSTAAMVAKESEQGSSTGQPYKLVAVFEGLDIPWGMAFINQDKIIVTERSGAMKLIDLKKNKSQVISGVPKVKASGQGGLLDVKIGPNFEKDGWIYLTYSKPKKNNAVTALARFRLAGHALTDFTDLLVTESLTSKGQHYGSRIAFDDKGFVYFTIGDRGVRPNGQDLTTHAGSIVRLHLDGSVPKDNPFVNQKDALNEIWSWGHRNPQGIAFDFGTKRLWAIEHGPRGGDEINLIGKGKNYGWPTISYGKEYWNPMSVGEGTHKEGMEQPIKYYVPSIAPSSLIIYRGAAFPQWQGNLFAGALAKKHLNRVVLNEKGEAIAEERLFESLDQRVRSLVVGHDDLIYFATDNGVIYKVEPKG